MSPRQFVSFVLVLSCVCATAVSAQTNTVTLSGVVTDDTGGALPGVTATVTNVATGLVRTAVTDGSGRYTVLGLPPAVYDVRVELQSFSPIVQRAQFQVGQTAVLDFRMMLGGLSEIIQVTTEVPAVQTESNALTRVVRTEEVDRLPSLTRDFTQLAALTPGVTVTANNVTISGNTTQSTGFVVDGTSMQAPTGGGSAIALVQDWIQEFSVLSSQFPAEFGTAQAGVVNAVTRSGTNQIRGRAFGYFQDEAWNSRLWRATTKNPFGLQRSGYQMGGPIVQDRLLYFAGYEINHSLTNIPVSISPIFNNLPGLSLNAAGTQAVGTVEQDTKVHSVIFKADYRRGIAHTLTPRIIVRKNNVSANGSATATNVPLSASRGPATGLNDSYQGAWTWVVSNSTLLDSRVEYRRNSISNGCFAAPTLYGYSTSKTNINTPTLVFPSGGPTLGCNGRWGNANERGWFINEALSMTRGSHSLKVGGVFMRPVNWVVETQNQNGRYTMASLALFNAANPATYPLAYAINFEPGAEPGWALGGSQFGLFAQDNWRVGGGLTLSFGLRYDAEAKLATMNQMIDTMVPPYNTRLNQVNPNKGNFAPRAGFTWAPGDTIARMAIRGGYGLFYNTSHNATFAAWAGQIGNTLQPGGALMNVSANNATLNPYCLGNTRCAAGVPADLQNALRQVLAFALANNTVPDLAAASVTLNGVTTALPGVAISPIPLSLGHVDQNIRTPYTHQETIGAQFDLGGGLSLSADVKLTQGRNQYIVRNVNRTREGQIVDPLFQSLTMLGNGGVLDVKQLLVDVAYRSRRGDSLQVAYALGKATNNSIANFSNQATGTAATNPFDFSVDQGPASTDQRHILNVSGNLSLPWGISLAPLFRATSGIRVNPVTNGRPSAAQGCQVYFSQCYPFNTTTGQVIGRNSFVGEPNWTLNARLSKEVRLGARRLTGMVEAFNLTNRVNFTGYSGNIGGTTGLVADLGGIVPTAADLMRQIQIGLRFDF